MKNIAKNGIKKRRVTNKSLKEEKFSTKKLA
jgi:hypothetical protein